MDESDLNRIEDALGRSLPNTFRNVMLNFPQKLIDAATMTDPDGNEFIDSMMITPNAEYILERNAECRRDPDWPNHYVPIGDNGCGEDYSVDVSDERCPVYKSGPHNDAMANGPGEDGYFERVSSDLQKWVHALAKRAE
jgi:hypothetical protein